LVKNQAQEIRTYLLAKIPVHPKNIVAKAAKAFACSRTTVHRHLNRLLRDREIIKTGTTRQTLYFLKTEKNKKILINIEPGVAEDQVWKENFLNDFELLPKNVREICEYGFLKMLNNVFDHSEGTTVIIKTEWTPDSISIAIRDDGIGIFRKIQKNLCLEDARASVLHLSKGKCTTDPGNHKGEGIFFASRVFDLYYIISKGISYFKSNVDDDWFLETTKDKNEPGTGLIMKIALDSKRKIQEVQAEYQYENLGEVPNFEKTHIMVKLSKFNEEHYVSRLQAKRICLGIEKFKHVVLDFKNITTVGKAFVYEIFRVFQNKNPKTKIIFINANDDIRFMIKYSLTMEE
jgi:hypothetical protein